MATSGAMDDSFRARVERIFGSLTTTGGGRNPATPAATPTPSSMWSLTDEEVEKRDWKKGRAGPTDRDDLPCSASFAGATPCRTRRRRAIFGSDDEDEEEEEGEGGGDGGRFRGGDDEGWEIRSSIGMDRTLDNEEEEDEYDRVAEGREDTGDYLYMKDVLDEGSYLSLPKVVRGGHCVRDPRANQVAAEIRLQEDNGKGMQVKQDLGSCKEVERVYAQLAVGDGAQVRPILKRKDNNSDSKPNKRVRFDPSSITSSQEDALETAHDISMDTAAADAIFSDNQVPDYIQNPSKYVRYSFGSSGEVDEKSNTEAYLDTLELIKVSQPGGLQSGPGDVSGSLPKSVTFIPRKKANDCKIGKDLSEVKQDVTSDVNQPLHQAGLAVAIAVEESMDLGVAAMEEDEKQTRAADQVLRKPGRTYRTKSCSEDTD